MGRGTRGQEVWALLSDSPTLNLELHFESFLTTPRTGPSLLQHAHQPGRPLALTETSFLAVPLKAEPLKVLGGVDNGRVPPDYSKPRLGTPEARVLAAVHGLC